MDAGIFLLQDNGNLVEMRQQVYNSESLLQELLAQYPRLLAGDQIDPNAPRRWLLVSREMPLATNADGAGRWAIDHLFLDQDAIPTIVEVKRSTDTRIRREVIGQMLDYAANAVLYWPVEAIRTTFETTCRQRGDDPDQELRNLLGGEADPAQFWQGVKTNLQAGKVRLVFVADIIPQELRRVVEFLNGQMDPAEVLAIEIRQYVGQNLKTLVPRVVGQTANAEQKKTAGDADIRQWDEDGFFQELTARKGDEAAHVARQILDWAKAHGLRIWFGKGKKDGSFFPLLDYKGTTYWLMAVWTYGRVDIQFQYMAGPFATDAGRLAVLQRLNAIPGLTLAANTITRRPSIPLQTLAEPSRIQQFLAVFDWMISEIKAT